MKGKRIIILLGSICLSLMLLAPMLAACAGESPAPTTTAPAPTTTAPAPQPTEPEVIKWKAQFLVNTNPPFGPYSDMQYVMHAGYTHTWAEWISEASGGRLEIELYDPESLFPGSEALTAIEGGVADCWAGGQPSYWVGTMPEMAVVGGLPQAWETFGEMYDAWYNYGIEERIQPLYEAHNQVFFPVLHMPLMNVHATFPMPHPDSIKGKKIRTFGQWSDYIDMLGGSPMTIPYSDVYMTMKLGTVDGAWTGCMALESIKLKEVTSDFLAMPNACLDCITINLDSLNALPEDIRYLIMSGTPRHAALHAMYMSQQFRALLNIVKAEGTLNTWEWSSEEMAEIRAQCKDELWPKFASKTPLCQELTDIIEQQLTDLGKL